MDDIGSVLADVQTNVDDNNVVDPATTEGNQEEIVENGADLETNKETAEPQKVEGNQGNQAPTKNPPFHEHPRWKEKINELKALQEKMSAVEAENSRLKSQPEPGKEAEPDPSEDDRQFEEFKKDLPVHKFKTGKDGDDYQSYDELYDAIRKAMFKDLAAVSQVSNKRNAEREEMEVKTLREGFQNTLTSIETSLGDPVKFEEFKEFASELYALPEFEKRPPKLEMVYAAYLKDFFKPGVTKPNANKQIASKVSKTTKPSLGGDKKPGYSFIANSSMEEIADAMM